MADNAALLTEIRDNYDFAKREWQEIYDEGDKDIRFVAGDPWPAEERSARKNADRPCLSLDELSQYCNQAINNLRANKRAIKVTPEGNGANDDTAELRQGRIRQIEYKSNAQAAYITSFENAVQRSFGFFRIGARYKDSHSRQMELYIGSIPNPKTVLIDPMSQEVDGSDMDWAFVLDQVDTKAFPRRWPDAEITSFSGELQQQYPSWIRERSVQVAEYWRVQKTVRTRIWFQNGEKAFLDELQKTPEFNGVKLRGFNLTGANGVVIAQVDHARRTEDPKVQQFITNGVEVLEEHGWPGKYIPIIPVFGKQLYVDGTEGSRRRLYSLVRLARDPYLLYCYYRSCQAEVVGMTPKTPFVGYRGQFDANKTQWEQANRVPYAFLEVEPIVDGANGAVLPLPQRQVFEPPIQALEIGAESARRAIQSAIGIHGLLNGQRGQEQSAKSGIALQELQSQTQMGNFHFTDNFGHSLEHAGRVIDDLLPYYHNKPGYVTIRNPDDSSEIVHVNEPYRDPATGEMKERRMDTGDHEITISTGPSSDSQREEVNAFGEQLAGNPNLVAAAIAGQTTASKLLSKVIRMKNLGPLGDEMADILDPPEQDQKADPAQLQAALEKHQQFGEALMAELQECKRQLEEKQAEIDSKERIAADNNNTKLAIAELQAETQKAIAMLREEAAAIKARMDAAGRDEDREFQRESGDKERAIKRETAAAKNGGGEK